MGARLDEFDRNEWWDACRALRPDLTEADFDKMWGEFQAEKASRNRKQKLS